MNLPQIFEHEEFGQFRMIEDNNGDLFFVGKDVAEILGYSDTNKAIKMHVDEEDKLTRRFVVSGQNRNMIVINESGLYSLILSSKLPTARKFKRWVTSELLPSIGRYGLYGNLEQLETLASNPELLSTVVEQLKELGSNADTMMTLAVKLKELKEDAKKEKEELQKKAKTGSRNIEICYVKRWIVRSLNTVWKRKSICLMTIAMYLL